MQKQSGIFDSVSFIEGSLADALSIDALAERTYFSRSHYQRLFRAVVGEPVMEYIKKRRLQQACRALGEGTATVLDVAVAYGYESYEGFSRAFKAYFGVSPGRYRKINAGMEKEENAMLSEEMKGSLARHSGEIIHVLVPIAAEFTQLAIEARDAGAKAGNPGKSALILSEEYGHLARRISDFVEEIKSGCEEPEASVFDLYDRMHARLKGLDDIFFQMNLLHFLSAIETARMAVPPPEAFASIDTKMRALTTQAMKTRSSVLHIMEEVMRQIRAEIKKDADARMASAVELLQKIHSEGVVLAADAKGAALSLGENGHAFLCVAKDLERRLKAIHAATEACMAFAHEREPVETALWRMAAAAFMTNLNAFNAKVETARSGGVDALEECTPRILRFPARMEDARRACMEILDESVKLTELARRETLKDLPNEKKFDKALEDIIFQSELLLAQMAIETERCKHEPFRALVKGADGALAALTAAVCGELAKDKEAVTTYHHAIAEITEAYQREIAVAGNLGLGAVHGVIAREFAQFNWKIEMVLTYV